MKWQNLYNKEKLDRMALQLFEEQRQLKRLDGWFRIKEIQMNAESDFEGVHSEIKSAKLLERVVTEIPLQISANQVFAGTQSDAFAKTYALINPNFHIDSFEGYCDPLAVFDDIEPNDEFTEERIRKVRDEYAKSPYVQDLKKVYQKTGDETKEVVYFVEQVTGHTIADFKPIIKGGITEQLLQIAKKRELENDQNKLAFYDAMELALKATIKLANRYAQLAMELSTKVSKERKRELLLIANTLQKVPEFGASNLFEAIQSFIILWQVMCIEQSPNPYAFSVGNVDRIFEDYREMDGADREMTTSIFKHFLTFFNVGDRSWAISQNLMVSGRLSSGEDLSNATTYAMLDAYFETNYPQPILSVKLHRNTPQQIYKEMGKFFFTPGCLTPSLFNDDSLFKVLDWAGIETEDLADYSIAGCQEPLVIGKDNGNTTNSWLNLGKILELTLNDGYSAISGKKIGLGYTELGMSEIEPVAILSNIESLFYKQLDYFLDQMSRAANDCSLALSHLKVPFLSSTMGGIDSGFDMRDVNNQGTKYNGSGCLIHGLSVLADSFVAINDLLKERPEDAGKLLLALRDDFSEKEDLRQYLLTAEKYGNNSRKVDDVAQRIVNKVSDKVASLTNYLGNPFRPDWSSPSTHLLYGYWVGATPDGRHAREMLNYGLDPLCGDAHSGLGFRILSIKKLSFEKMTGGYASHFGIDPKYFPEESMEEKGMSFYDKVIQPLFFCDSDHINPFYLYVNVNTPDMLRKVIANPKKFAPSGVYIMRIHGTFVNFLDLSAEIQNDIILRLDLESTKM
ncbi:pyruvate formate lyase family protein [Sunxiuqinia sp. A32]|uniref:pyruvate formate lyase family protein n=1 Tax=Sunxiuqinia sp. A32 TaxID=3461496 RepID=UPI0040451FC3